MNEIVALTEVLAERIERMEPVEGASQRLAASIREAMPLKLSTEELGRCIQLLALAVQARRVQDQYRQVSGTRKDEQGL